MSLWQVPDLQTSAFMTRICYKNWLEGDDLSQMLSRRTRQEMRQRFLDPFGVGRFATD
jgi:hypothetical protein